MAEIPDTSKSVLNEEEIRLAAELLSKLEPGRQPAPIFYQIARLRPLPSVELMIFGLGKQYDEVLLTRRKPDDPVWPNLWHIPGVVLDEADDTLQSALDRVVQHELEGLKTTSMALMETYLRRGERGPEVPSVYIARAIGEPAVGKFFNVGELPEDIVSSHPPLIDKAAKLLAI